MWLYLIVFAATVISVFANRRYRSELFSKLDRKKHPLKFLYPAGARLEDIYRKHFPVHSDAGLRELMKSLCVRENADQQIYIHKVKKCSVIILTFLCALLCLALSSASDTSSDNVRELERADYGQGTRNYELEFDYRDKSDTVSISVDQVKLDEQGIRNLFERSYEAVYKKLLGENESADAVTRPLDFITEYSGFNIFWNIEDKDLMGYNGQSKIEIGEGQSALVNISATFSMDDVNQMFSYPIRLVSPVLDERQKLLRSIIKEIEASNDIHDQRVELPDRIDGDSIAFHRVSGHDTVLVFVMAVMAIAVIILFYDRKLENAFNERKDQLMMDFSRIVSKISLLYEAGLSIHGAFERIVSDHERSVKTGKKELLHEKLFRAKNEYPSDYAYLEMKLALEKIRNGESEASAYAQFGKRCGLQPYIKLGNLLERNLSKGSKGMRELLKEEVDNAFEQRKRIARKKGEQASTKMLLPMTLLLLVVVAIIAFPALLSLGI